MSVIITMQVDITKLFNLYNTIPTPTIATMNGQLGSIITHAVTGGTLTLGYNGNNPDSTQDTIAVSIGSSIAWRFLPINLPPNNPIVTAAMKCNFVNMDVATKPLTVIGIATQGDDPTTTGQKQLTATAGQAEGTNNYAITFTINNHQLTFDPKIVVRGPHPL